MLLAAGGGSAFLFRSAGAALILAGLIYLLLARQRKEFYLYIAVVGCLILPWVLWQAMHGSAAVENPLLAYYQSYESPAFFLAGSDPACRGSDYRGQSPVFGSDRGFYDASFISFLS